MIQKIFLKHNLNILPAGHLKVLVGPGTNHSSAGRSSVFQDVWQPWRGPIIFCHKKYCAVLLDFFITLNNNKQEKVKTGTRFGRFTVQYIMMFSVVLFKCDVRVCEAAVCDFMCWCMCVVSEKRISDGYAQVSWLSWI